MKRLPENILEKPFIENKCLETNVLEKQYIENKCLEIMNSICEQKLHDGYIARYRNEVEYDQNGEILAINTTFVPITSIKSITIELTPSMITGDIDNTINNLNKEIEQEYGN